MTAKEKTNNVDTTKEFTHLGLCAGYGGIELALHRVIRNLRTVALCEIEAFACANLVAKMEAGLMDCAPIWTDLKTFPWADFRDRVDILTGGYPCQPFSAAGKRLGTEDPRHLWPFIADGIRILRPKLCFFENVEGHISLGLREVIGELGAIGYQTTWGIFSASEVGAPHQRKRVFILAYDSSAGLQGREWCWQAGTQGQPSGHLAECGGAELAYDQRQRIEKLGWEISTQSQLDSPGDDGGNATKPCQFCGYDFDHRLLGKYGCPNCEGEGGGELAYAGRIEPQGWCGAADGQQYGAGRIPRGEPAPRHDQVWPSRPGEPQHAWEPPRVVANSERSRGEEPRHKHADILAEPSGGDAEAMGNATSERPRTLGAEPTGQQRQASIASAGDAMGNTNSPRSQEWPRQRGAGIQGTHADGGADAGGQTEPPLGGDADGPASGLGYAELQVTCDNRTDELRLLGNGVVPATAERAFRVLMEEIISA